jgi:hypothetical protein
MTSEMALELYKVFCSGPLIEYWFSHKTLKLLVNCCTFFAFILNKSFNVFASYIS